MKLYNISEINVESVIENGEREILESEKLSITYKMKDQFEHPLKVIVSQENDLFMVITVYPVKGGIK